MKMQDVLRIVDNTTSAEEMSAAQAFEWLGELMDEVEARMEALRADEALRLAREG